MALTKFWEWRNVNTPTTSAVQAEPKLEMVELYTAHAMVIGQVNPDGRRLSDILNSSSHLRLRDARSISFGNGVDGTEGRGWTSIDTAEVLVAMPPDHTSPRQMRIHRRRHRVRITTGAFVVTGSAHVLPGIELDPYVLRSRMRFLAMTDVYVTSLTDPAWERSARVVLVNVQPVTDLTEVLTIS